MTRILVPPPAGLGLLPDPLSADEQRLLDVFDRQLPHDWEIYVRPHLNGLRPGFVLLNPSIGIGVFEVARLGAPDDRELDSENPVRRVDATKRAIRDLYCPRLGIRLADDPDLQALITAGVVVTDVDTAVALDAFAGTRAALGHFRREITPRYHPIAGHAGLAAGAIRTIFPDGLRPYSTRMDPVYAEDLRTWLVESEHDRARRRPLGLTWRQNHYATTRTKSGYRWIAGPVGSGKSLVLAARATELSAEGKDVLVVSFNITLGHYLRDLAARHHNPQRRLVDFVTWTHFHKWCKDVCYGAGFGRAYESLWWGGGRRDEGLDELVPAPDPDDHDLDPVLERRLPALASRAVDRAVGRNRWVATYDAILIDEGQDFDLDWIDLLGKVLRPGGEMLLVADTTQDLYGRAARWRQDQLRSRERKFGRPVILEENQRMPPALLDPLRRYAAEFLPADAVPPLKSHHAQLDLWGATQWIQVGPTASAADEAARAVLRMPAFDPTRISFSDVTLLAQSHRFGLSCVERIERAGIEVAHTYAEDDQVQRRRKLAFVMGDGRVKATTIKSFKGWEGRAIVLCIERATNAEDRAEIYVGLSRLKQHDEGSFLTVVCSAPEIEAFARASWPNFHRVAPADVPAPVLVRVRR